MLKPIRELSIGDTVTITLLVKSAEIATTKGGKPYLRVELTDGTDTIQGVNWDQGSTAPPVRNEIIKVVASVTEWSGNKQLNIKNYITDLEVSVAAFSPKGAFSITDYKMKAKMLIDEITPAPLQQIVRDCFRDNAKLWDEIPSAKGIHHAFVGGNLKHSVDVAVKAKVLAEVTPNAHVGLCIAGGLLQDLGKLYTYNLNGAVIEMTERGQMIEHIMIGAIMLEKYRTPENTAIIDLLQHIISSHHGKLEYGSPTVPMFLEALIVCAADGLDAKSQIIHELNAKAKPEDIQTDKAYALENRQMFTQRYIHSLLG